MKLSAVIRFLFLTFAILAVAWSSCIAYVFYSHIAPIARATGFNWSIEHGALMVRSSAGSGSTPVAVFVILIGIPLIAIVAAWWLNRVIPAKSLLIQGGSIVAAIGLVALGYGLTRTKPDAWVGRPLPPLKLDYFGAPPELAGHPVVLEFWATWCGPCVANIPHLNELQAKFKDAGLVVVGVSDENRAVVEAFRKKTAMDYFVAMDPDRSLRGRMGVTGIPHSFLADKTGKIIWHGHPYYLTEAQIAAALK